MLQLLGAETLEEAQGSIGIAVYRSLEESTVEPKPPVEYSAPSTEAIE